MAISRTIGVTAALGALALGGCKELAKTSADAPPRATDEIVPPQQSSLIAVPVDADVSILTNALEREIPRTLWSINQRFDKCVEPQRVKVLGKQIAVTPKSGCTIVGTVTRGPIRLRGAGRDFVVDLPIRAVIRARDVGGIIKQETATGSAMARARVTLTLGNDWQPRSRVDLDYDWRRQPGIDFLGQRISFTDQADKKLAPVVAQLERTLPRELARLNLRGEVANAWRQAFTTLSLNRENPPVWARITPQKLSYGGHEIVGRTLRLKLGMEALTETFVGPRPEAPKPTPLPPPSRITAGNTLRFFVPVTADYAELEPVIMRALQKRAQRPFDLPKLGPVMAEFRKVEAYGTDGGRVAVGLTITARPADRPKGEMSGIVWLTAMPVNEANSRTVRFTGLQVTGDTNRVGGDILLTLANSPGVTGTIAESLTQNFDKDFAELIGKIEHAIVNNREGDFVINARMSKVETGQLKAAGMGLYLPVWLNGDARVSYKPR